MVDSRLGYQPLLTELMALYPAYLQGRPRPVREGWRRVGQLGHGWYLRCHRGVEGLLLLDGAGFSEEASPLRRSIIEHAVALRWLAAEGDGILDTVARGHAVSGQRTRDAIALAGWTSVDLDEVDRAVASARADARDPADDNLLHFAQRVKRYGDGHTMPGYLTESARSHPSYESAICYVELPGGSLLKQSRDAVWQVPFATTRLLEALLAVRQMFSPTPWQEELPGLVRRFQEVTDHVRAEDGLAPVDWGSTE
jgi:hypothetical protein